MARGKQIPKTNVIEFRKIDKIMENLSIRRQDIIIMNEIFGFTR